LNVHPILLQREFLSFDEETLDELEGIYNSMKRRNVRRDFISLQKELSLPLTQGHGLNYARYPSFDRFRQALKLNTEHAAISSRPCHSCGDTPVISQVNACGHFLCKVCTDDARASAECTSCNGEAVEISTAGDDELDLEEEDEDYDLASPANTKETTKSKSKEPTMAQDWLCFKGLAMPSTKFRAAKLKILQWLSEDRDTKIIIFTHWRKL
jgi:hypothetical protein